MEGMTLGTCCACALRRCGVLAALLALALAGLPAAGAASPDQIMRVAMMETAQGNLIIQLYGARATVAAQRAAFDAMVRALRRRDK